MKRRNEIIQRVLRLLELLAELDHFTFFVGENGLEDVQLIAVLLELHHCLTGTVRNI